MNHVHEEVITFSKNWVRNMGKDMLDVIKAVYKITKIVTWIALCVSIPHQAGYLLSLTDLFSGAAWTGMQAVLLSVTIVLGAAAVPLCTDMITFACIKAIGGKAIKNSSRVAILLLMLFPVSVSSTLNYLAPGPHVIQVCFVILVCYIPLGELVGVLASRPDFRKVTKSQNEILEQVAEPEPPKVRRPKPANKTEHIKRLFTDDPAIKVDEVVKRTGAAATHVYNVRRAMQKEAATQAA